MARQDSNIRRRYLGNELQRLREQAKKKLEDVADYMNCSAAKISRIEGGHVGATASDVRDMLEYYGVPRALDFRTFGLSRGRLVSAAGGRGADADGVSCGS